MPKGSGTTYRRCPKPLTPRCASGRCAHNYSWRFVASGRLYSGTEASERAARLALHQAQASAASGTLQTARQRRAAEAAAEAERAAAPTLGDYLDEWLAGRTRLRPSTVVGYRVIVKRHIRPALGDVRLPEVSTRQLRDMMRGLAEPDSAGRVRTTSTLSRVKSLLGRALGDAVQDGLVPINVARDLRVPESAAPSRAAEARGTFTSADLANFLARVAGSEYGPALRFLAVTGCRRGEALGLRWCDVDVTTGVVTVRGNLTQSGGEFRLGPVKTQAGNRVVPLDAESAAWLREHRRQQAAEALRWGRGVWNPEGFVFVRPDGSAIRPDSLSHFVRRVTAGMGRPELHTHSLRHSFATAGLEITDVKVLSTVLGHSSVQITRDLYQHPSNEMAAAAVERVAELRRQGAGSPR